MTSVYPPVMSAPHGNDGRSGAFQETGRRIAGVHDEARVALR